VHKIYEIERSQNITGKMKRQTAISISKASVFLFFPNVHFFKTILASCTNCIFAFAPNYKAKPTAKAKEPFFSNFSH
jgi:hypothetical protein